MPNIIIEINKRTGEVKLEGIDFQGQECQLPMQDLSDLLGETVDVKPKGNVYQVFVDDNIRIGG